MPTIASQRSRPSNTDEEGYLDNLSDWNEELAS